MEAGITKYLGIDRLVFRGESNISAGELEAFLSTMFNQS